VYRGGFWLVFSMSILSVENQFIWWNIFFWTQILEYFYLVTIKTNGIMVDGRYNCYSFIN
jgi:hypothetical protein